MVIFTGGSTEVAFVSESGERIQRMFELDNGSSAGNRSPVILVEQQFAGFDATTILLHPEWWSDILGDTVNGTVGFTSQDNLTYADLLPYLGGLATARVFAEPDYNIDLAKLGLLSPGHTGYFQSDVEAHVPDAGTSVTLFRFALAGLGLLRRKLA